MNTLSTPDLHFVVSRIPKDIKEIAKNSGLVIGGGFIRSTISGEKVSDIDLFGPDKAEMKTIAYKLATERKGRVHETDNALTVLAPPRFPIQFITRWLYSNPPDVVTSFDFTVCQAAVWFKDDKWQSSIAESFYPDLAARRLVYTKPERNEDAGGSILRVRKFLSRGYNIQAQSLADVIARLVMKVDFSKVSDETMIGKVLAGLLREVDPLAVIDGIDPIDEHAVEKEAVNG